MARGSKSLRLFVAVYPPREVAQSLLQQVDALELPAHRSVAVEQVHLTLQFVGDVDLRQLDETVESVQRSVKGLDPFELTMRELITLPKRGRARLIAAETDQPPAMMEMQRRLAHRLARNTRKQPGDRFLPHMTLLRFRSPEKYRIESPDAAIELDSFEVRSVSLMRSTLRPEGAVHELVQDVTIG